MRKSKCVGTVIAIRAIILMILIIPKFVDAQEVSPDKDIKALHFLEGNWSVENYILKSGKWETIGTTNAKFDIELNGKFINEKVKYLTKYGELNMTTVIGYDSRLKNFKLSSMDADYGNMDIYIGEWTDEELVFTNLNSDLPIVLDDGKELFFRLTYSEINYESFTHVVEGTTDMGETWFNFSKSTYTKN